MRLKKVFVAELFGRFTHEIPIKLTDRITIIHSPNGFGKTMILRMLYAFFNQSYFTLARIPFRELHLEFDNRASISVHRNVQKETAGQRDVKTDLKITYSEPGKTSQTFTPEPGARPEQLGCPISAIEDIIAELDQIGSQSWRHLGTGETLSLEEVLERYRDQLPLREEYRTSNTPEWLLAVCNAIPVRFINTERLYTLSTRRRRPYPGAYTTSSELAVRKYSQELGETIKHTLTKYGALSQSLDRTFPARLVAEPLRSDITLAALREKLADIESKRARLVDAGLLAQDPEYWGVPSLEKVDETRLGVLSVYARDAEEKLSSFDEVFAKVDLFKKIVNARFLHKRLTIGQVGFGVVTSYGSPLDPALLSSGEQHELVLLYELLFRVGNNSIILIDEPEISLHIAWQEAFLKDLGQMAELSKFDALIATHSPQIISDRWDLTVELKGPSE